MTDTSREAVEALLAKLRPVPGRVETFGTHGRHEGELADMVRALRARVEAAEALAEAVSFACAKSPQSRALLTEALAAWDAQTQKAPPVRTGPIVG